MILIKLIKNADKKLKLFNLGQIGAKIGQEKTKMDNEKGCAASRHCTLVADVFL